MNRFVKHFLSILLCLSPSLLFASGDEAAFLKSEVQDAIKTYFTACQFEAPQDSESNFVSNVRQLYSISFTMTHRNLSAWLDANTATGRGASAKNLVQSLTEILQRYQHHEPMRLGISRRLGGNPNESSLSLRNSVMTGAILTILASLVLFWTPSAHGTPEIESAIALRTSFNGLMEMIFSLIRQIVLFPTRVLPEALRFGFPDPFRIAQIYARRTDHSAVLLYGGFSGSIFGVLWFYLSRYINLLDREENPDSTQANSVRRTSIQNRILGVNSCTLF